jgi:hypothetical protein
MVMNKESEKIWKEAVVVYIKVLSPYLPRGIEENHEKPQGSRYRRQVSNSSPLWYMSKALSLEKSAKE